MAKDDAKRAAPHGMRLMTRRRVFAKEERASLHKRHDEHHSLNRRVSVSPGDLRCEDEARTRS
jgi:hypothetical protein